MSQYERIAQLEAALTLRDMRSRKKRNVLMMMVLVCVAIGCTLGN